MSKIKQVDDLTTEEIKDIEEFYTSDKDKKSFKSSDEFINWLNN